MRVGTKGGLQWSENAKRDNVFANRPKRNLKSRSSDRFFAVPERIFDQTIFKFSQSTSGLPAGYVNFMPSSASTMIFVIT